MEENGGGCPKLDVLQEIIRLYGDFMKDFTGDFDHKTLWGLYGEL